MNIKTELSIKTSFAQMVEYTIVLFDLLSQGIASIDLNLFAKM